MLYARVLRSPHPHARIRAIDASKARALPGVKAIVTHENCTCRVGRRVDLRRCAVQRRDQEDHQAPALRVQQPGPLRRRTGRRRRRGRSAHRRRGAAADRGRLRDAAVRARSGGGAETGRACRSGPKATSRRTRATKPQPIGPEARQRRGRLQRRGSRVRGSLLDRVRPQRADGAARLRRRTGKATSSPSTRRPAASPTAAPTWRAISASRRKKSASSAAIWAATSATRTRTRTPI